MKRDSLARLALRRWRLASKLGSRQLSRKLGMSDTFTTQVERGECQPRLQTVIAIEELTGGEVTCMMWKEIVT